MKRLFKRLFLVILIILFGCYTYIKFLWQFHYSEKDVEKLATQIKSCKKLPDDFYILYEKKYLNSLSYNSVRYNIEQLISGKNSFYTSPNSKVIYHFRPNERVLTTSLSWKLEDLGITQKQSLNYIFYKVTDFLYNAKGLEKASQFYFEKEVSKLNRKEIATLILMEQNPRIFNPKRTFGKEKLKTELPKLLD